jgi:hypothetical protein
VKPAALGEIVQRHGRTPYVGIKNITYSDPTQSLIAAEQSGEEAQGMKWGIIIDMSQRAFAACEPMLAKQLCLTGYIFT